MRACGDQSRRVQAVPSYHLVQYLQGVQRRALAQVVAREPKGDAPCVRRIFPDSSNENLIAAFRVMGHRVDATAGVVYDLTGSYVIPFSICGLLLIGASLASFLIRERKYSVKYQPQGTLQASTATD